MSFTAKLSHLMAKATEHLLPNAAPAPSPDAVRMMGEAQANANPTGAEDTTAHILDSGHVGALVAKTQTVEPKFTGGSDNFTERAGRRPGTPSDAPKPKPYDKRIHGDNGLADVSRGR